MNELKQISKSKCFEGDQLVFSHYSDVCNCDMTFALYLPLQTNAEKLQVIWFLSGLTCTHENAMIKSGFNVGLRRKNCNYFSRYFTKR